MDLIYMNAQMEDLGVLHDYTFDLAFGLSENDFECKIVRSNHCCEAGYFLYYEGTEYGGIIDDIKVDTANEEITYFGRTWHGILESKIVEPDGDYLTLSGEANTVLDSLISRMGLYDLFIASAEDSGINISSYKMNRYIGGYSGICKMLKKAGAKLKFEMRDGKVQLSALPIVDYSKDEQFDTDQFEFIIKKRNSPVNHVICLGKGNLAEREVIHVYADKNGTVSHTQSLTGIAEVTQVYDYANAESLEELEQGGIDIIRNAYASDEIDFNFNANETNYDIGDVVGAVEEATQIEVSAEITKKIVTIQDGITTISYKVGE